MDNLRFLNPDDFKRWMKKQDIQDADEGINMIGTTVESKYCGKRIARNITLEDGKAGRVVREFIQNGGVVKAVEGDEYLIEVESGSFFLHKKNIIS